MNDLEKPIYISLKPLAKALGLNHRTLEKIMVIELKNGNKVPRYQLPHARSYLYILDEFLPWFQKLLVEPKLKKQKKKKKPIDLFAHQKLTSIGEAYVR
jgi:hypothetical protein